jgi:hypothetical protein
MKPSTFTWQVYYHARRRGGKCWQGVIRYNGEQLHIGYYRDKNLAIEGVNAWGLKTFKKKWFDCHQVAPRRERMAEEQAAILEMLALAHEDDEPQSVNLDDVI